MKRYIISTFLETFKKKPKEIFILYKDKLTSCKEYEILEINGNPNSFMCIIKEDKALIQVRVYQVFV